MMKNSEKFFWPSQLTVCAFAVVCVPWMFPHVHLSYV